MGMFQKILALLIFSTAFAGCHTPLIDIKIGETLSGADLGGGCRRPCGGGGSRRVKAVEGGEEVKIIHKRVIYYVGNSDGDPQQLVNYELNQKQANFEEGDKVKVTRNEDDSVTFTKVP